MKSGGNTPLTLKLEGQGPFTQDQRYHLRRRLDSRSVMETERLREKEFTVP